MSNKNNHDIFEYRHMTNTKKVKQELNLPQFNTTGRFGGGYSFFIRSDNNFKFTGDWDISHFTFNIWITIVTDEWNMNHPIVQFSKNGSNVLYFYNWPYRQQILMNGSYFVERETGLYGQHYKWHYLTISFDNSEKVARLFWDGSLWHTKSWNQGTNTSIDAIGINYPTVITNNNTPIWMDDMYIDFTYAQKANFSVPTNYRARAVDDYLSRVTPIFNNLNINDE